MTDQHHVVVVGRAGNHPGSKIYLTEKGSRKQAIVTREHMFRKEHDLPKSVQLVCQIVFSDDDPNLAEAFIGVLVEKLEEKERMANDSNAGL